MDDFPLLLRERVQREFSNKAKEILEGLLSRKKEEVFKINSEKIDEQDLMCLIKDYSLKKLPGFPTLFSTEQKKLYTKNPLIFAGIYYFQSLSSTLPVRILDIQEGESVLDACASPGSKSTQILSALKGTGFLVANEINRTRIGRLVQNITEWGADNIWVCQKDTRHFHSLPQFFDKILVDAPCSGEGTFYKDKEALLSWSPHKVEECASLQKQILSNVLPSLKDGGELVYSTCTLSVKENEEVVLWVLEKYGDYLELVSFSDYWEGGEEGVSLSSTKESMRKDIVEKTRRVFPYHKNFSGEAFFLAKFRLKKAISSNFAEKKTYKKTYTPLLEVPMKMIETFWKEMQFSFPCDKKSLLCLGHHLYYYPHENKNFLQNMVENLHPHYVGCRLGSVKHKWILPTAEWVLKGDLIDIGKVLDLDEEEIRHFLLGETQPFSYPKEGFIPISYKKIPLGMGKISSEGFLKSYFSPIAGKKVFS